MKTNSNKVRKNYLKGLLALMAVFVFGTQANAQVEMADTFRQEGKIYVVVLVMLTVFIGIVVYLISLDRKIKNIEKNK